MLLGQGHALACGEPNASAKPAGRSGGLTVGFFEINILLTKLFEGPRGIVVFVGNPGPLRSNIDPLLLSDRNSVCNQANELLTLFNRPPLSFVHELGDLGSQLRGLPSLLERSLEHLSNFLRGSLLKKTDQTSPVDRLGFLGRGRVGLGNSARGSPRPSDLVFL